MKKRLPPSFALAALLSLGLYAIAAPAPSAHAAPATGHTTITRISGSSAIAGFEFTHGDVMGFVQVEASPQGFQFPPTPISGPAVHVVVSEFNSVTNKSFVGDGVAPARGLQIDSKRLTTATLPEVTVPVAPVDEFGNPIGPPFDVHVAVTWTGVGNINTQTVTFHSRIPHVINETFHFKGTFREATVSATITYPSPLVHSTITLTGADATFAQLMSSGTMDIIVQH